MVEHISITRGEIIEHLSRSMFDDLEMNPDYLLLIIAEGFMGYNNYTDDNLVFEYKEYINPEFPNDVVVTLLEDQVMGYRSTVAYKIKFDKTDDFWGFIAEAKLDPETVLCFDEKENNALWQFTVDEEKYEICFYAESVKWYDDYPEVKCHQALWEKAEERDGEGIEVDGAWCRIGEESDDNHERYFGNDPYEMVCISRQVIVDWAQLNTFDTVSNTN